MRTLLINPDMPFAYWSMETSAWFKEAKALIPPLGLLTVAALLPDFWELRLVDLQVRKLTEADWQWADLVMISGMQIQKSRLLELVQEAKKRGITVVAGGTYPTVFPEEVFEAGADVIVRGEAEGLIPLLLQAIEEKRQTVLKSAERPELDISPIPRYDLVNFSDYVVMNIQTSRGCPYNCEFCDVINLFGRKPRYKKPEQVVAELQRLFDLGWRGQVFVSDDNFIGNKEHARAILDKLIPWMKEHREPFYYWTQTSVNLGQDLEMIDLMTTANFSTVFIGVETTDADALNKSGKHHNKADQLQDWIHNINANGLEIVASFILGFDGEKPRADQRICQIVEDCSIPMAMINILTAVPGTALFERLIREGRLKSISSSKGVMGYVLNYIPTRPEAEIIEEWRQTIIQLFKPEKYLARAYNYILNMRPTRRSMGIPDYQEGPQPQLKKELDLSRVLLDLRGGLKLFWLQGLKSTYRVQFWRQLWNIWRRNPSRLTKYLVLCAMGESSFIMRKKLLNNPICLPDSSSQLQSELSAFSKLEDTSNAEYKGSVTINARSAD